MNDTVVILIRNQVFLSVEVEHLVSMLVGNTPSYFLRCPMPISRQPVRGNQQGSVNIPTAPFKCLKGLSRSNCGNLNSVY